MHVVVVGCGRVGSELAVRLTEAGHSVTVVDKNVRAFRRLPTGFTGKTVRGFGFDRDHLEEAGIRDAQALAAVTSGDNSNILTARIARETYGVASVVARIYDPRRAVIYQRLGIPTVATVTWTTDHVLRRLLPHTTTEEWTDATGSVALVERDLPASAAGRKLDTLVDGHGARLVAITRNGETTLAGSGLVGQEGDVLLLMVARAELPALEGMLA